MLKNRYSMYNINTIININFYQFRELPQILLYRDKTYIEFLSAKEKVSHRKIVPKVKTHKLPIQWKNADRIKPALHTER